MSLQSCLTQGTCICAKCTDINKDPTTQCKNCKTGYTKDPNTGNCVLNPEPDPSVQEQCNTKYDCIIGECNDKKQCVPPSPLPGGVVTDMSNGETYCSNGMFRDGICITGVGYCSQLDSQTPTYQCNCGYGNPNKSYQCECIGNSFQVGKEQTIKVGTNQCICPQGSVWQGTFNNKTFLWESGSCVELKTCNQDSSICSGDLMTGSCNPIDTNICQCKDNAEMIGGKCNCKYGYDKKEVSTGVWECKEQSCTDNQQLCVEKYGQLGQCIGGQCQCKQGASIVEGKCMCDGGKKEYEGKCITGCGDLIGDDITKFCGPESSCSQGQCVCGMNAHLELGKCVCNEGLMDDEKGKCVNNPKSRDFVKWMDTVKGNDRCGGQKGLLCLIYPINGSASDTGLWTQQINDAAKEFPLFCNGGNEEMDKKEFSAFLSIVGAETSFSSANGFPATIENGCGKGADPKVCAYNQQSGPQCKTGSEGKLYYGRGPLQISWNYNYAELSKYLYGNDQTLLCDPDLVADNPVIAWQSALWFWMNEHGYGGKCPPVNTNSSIPVGVGSPHVKMQQDDGGTGMADVINIINGGYDCCPTSGYLNQYGHTKDRIVWYISAFQNWTDKPPYTQEQLKIIPMGSCVGAQVYDCVDNQWTYGCQVKNVK